MFGRKNREQKAVRKVFEEAVARDGEMEKQAARLRAGMQEIAGRLPGGSVEVAPGVNDIGDCIRVSVSAGQGKSYGVTVNVARQKRRFVYWEQQDGGERLTTREFRKPKDAAAYVMERMIADKAIPLRRAPPKYSI